MTARPRQAGEEDSLLDPVGRTERILPRPVMPTAEPSDPVAAASGPEVAAAQRCTACGKSNHAGVTSCVFCGGALGASLSRTNLWNDTLGKQAEPQAAPESSTASPSDRPPASGRSRSSAISGFDEVNAPPIADPLIGVVVADRYRILEGLGRGGMGIVYKVEHTRIGKLLAMKLLTGELSRNPDVVRRFKHEALTVSKLSSPNTVQVFDFGVSDGLTYLVMELVAGEDLGRTLRSGGPMPFARIGKVLVQVCNSLAEAHQKGIVHRDIKPENIMLMRAKDGTDIAKVLDFGLAKIREGSDLNDVTSQGAIVGTPYFMAPEQVRGEAVDSRTDLYALGALMYRALTGHYPFNGPTPMSVFTKHLTEAPMPLSERAPELAIPARVNDLVLRALSKNPADRFQKVEDLQAVLVDELRQVSTSSLDSLLDSGALRRLAKVAEAEAVAQAQSQVAGLTAPAVEIATRDEVEAYERKLRRQRWGALVFLGVVLAGAAAGGAHLLVHETGPKFAGAEVEPNNSAAEATLVPLGRTATGMLGKRIDLTHSDRDFFAFDVHGADGEAPPAMAFIRLEVGAIPNMATCAMLFRAGHGSALGQYCVGRAGRALSIPSLRVEPGRYLLQVTQDLDPYGSPAPPFVHENVSDAYTFLVDPSEPDPTRETEPNDQIASAEVIAPGRGKSGALAWARDEDVYCVSSDTAGDFRWRVRDGPRRRACSRSPRSAPATRAYLVHNAGTGTPSDSDTRSPWTSEPMRPGDGLRCLRVRQAFDPGPRPQQHHPQRRDGDVAVDVAALAP
ncbi:MAG: serine/threonine-protein kinase [Polyangiaceae bacterium]